MGEQQRMTEAMTGLVAAYREGKRLSDKLCEVFGDDGGMLDVAGKVLDSMIVLGGEEQIDLKETYMYRIVNSLLKDEEAGNAIAQYIRMTRDGGRKTA